MAQAIGLFVKPVVPGQVKTRMMPELSADQAADLYSALLSDTAHLLESGKNEWDWIVFATDIAAVESTWPSTAPAPPAIFAQVGDDLGSRLGAAFASMFDSGYDRAMLLGSDHPNVPAEYLSQGLDALKSADVALGPASDGGYYTVGLSALHPEIFAGIQYSRPSVLAETVKRIQSHSLTLHCLPPWYDVDTIADLKLLMTHLEAQHLEFGDKATAPETRKVLESLRIP